MTGAALVEVPELPPQLPAAAVGRAAWTPIIKKALAEAFGIVPQPFRDGLETALRAQRRPAQAQARAKSNHNPSAKCSTIAINSPRD